jgi:hypothetical protein
MVLTNLPCDLGKEPTSRVILVDRWNADLGAVSLPPHVAGDVAVHILVANEAAEGAESWQPLVGDGDNNDDVITKRNPPLQGLVNRKVDTSHDAFVINISASIVVNTD